MVGRTWCSGTAVWLFSAALWGLCQAEESATHNRNLALAEHGGQVASWEARSRWAPTTLAMLADGLTTTGGQPRGEGRWDVGIQWPADQTVAAVHLRRLARGAAQTPWSARDFTIQVWKTGKWMDAEARVVGEHACVLRWAFEPVKTTRLRLVAATPIALSEIEVYGAPAQDAGQVVIEPLHPRIHRDRLKPCLDVERSGWASQACFARRDEGAIRVGNGFIELRLTDDLKALRVMNRTTGEGIDATADAPLVRAEVEAEGKTSAVTASQARDIEVRLESDREVARATITGTWPGLAVGIEVMAQQRQPCARLRLKLTNTGKQAVTLRSLSFGWPKDVRGKWHVLRQKQGGLFAAIEFPFLDTRRGLGYLPGLTLNPKATYTSESVAFGVYRNHSGGTSEEDITLGLWEWVYDYVRSVSPYRHRLIAHHQSWTGGGDPDSEATLTQWKQMGITSHMSGCVNWATKEKDRTPAGQWGTDKRADHSARLTEMFKKQGMKLTAWGGCEKLMTCMLEPRAEQFYTWIEALVKRYGLQGFEFDVLGAMPGSCRLAAHGHLPGNDGVYLQARRWFDFLGRLRQAGAGLLAHHGGEWAQTYSAAHYDMNHTGADPYPARVTDLSLAHVYTDFHRAYMLGGLFLDAQYLRTPHYRLYVEVGHSGASGPHRFDRRGWRYSMIGISSMTPTLIFMCLEGIPADDADFGRKWIEWTETNRDYLLQIRPLFTRDIIWLRALGEAALQRVIGFAHIRGDRGFVGLHNPTFCPQEVDLELALDPEAEEASIVQQIYPLVEQVIPGPDLQRFARGSHLRLTVPPRAVRLYKIGPPEFVGEPLMYAGTVDQVADPQAGLYLGEWKVAGVNDQTIRLTTTFEACRELRRCLDDRRSWAPAPPTKRGLHTDTAPYLVPLLVDNATTPATLDLPPKKMSLEAVVNGVRKPVAFYQPAHHWFYAVRLDDLKPQGRNRVELVLPNRPGLVFRGAYIDLPDRYRE